MTSSSSSSSSSDLLLELPNDNYCSSSLSSSSSSSSSKYHCTNHRNSHAAKRKQAIKSYLILFIASVATLFRTRDMLSFPFKKTTPVASEMLVRLNKFKGTEYYKNKNKNKNHQGEQGMIVDESSSSVVVVGGGDTTKVHLLRSRDDRSPPRQHHHQEYHADEDVVVLSTARIEQHQKDIVDADTDTDIPVDNIKISSSTTKAVPDDIVASTDASSLSLEASSTSSAEVV